MAKPKNIYITSTDLEYLRNLQEEYTVYGDFLTSLDETNGTLTVFAKRKVYGKNRPKADKPERNKRAESAGRRA